MIISRDSLSLVCSGVHALLDLPECHEQRHFVLCSIRPDSRAAEGFSPQLDTHQLSHNIRSNAKSINSSTFLFSLISSCEIPMHLPLFEVRMCKYNFFSKLQSFLWNFIILSADFTPFPQFNCFRIFSSLHSSIYFFMPSLIIDWSRINRGTNI